MTHNRHGNADDVGFCKPNSTCGSICWIWQFSSNLVLWFVLLAGVLLPGQAMPACTQYLKDGSEVPRHPSVSEEYADSQLVLEGIAVDKKHFSSPLDPEGVAAMFYTVRVTRVFKGKPGKTIVLASENTTSRFPMDLGVKYLLFINIIHIDLRADEIDDNWYGNGDFWFVDNCGNSEVSSLKQDAIRKILVLRVHHSHRK